MARNTLKVEFDDKEFRALLKRLGAAQSFGVIAAAVEEGSQVVAGELRAMAPNSGLPRTSPRKKKRGQQYPYKLSEDIVPKKAVVKNDAVYGMTLSLPYYAWMVEIGTSSESPRPWIRPAAEHARSRVVGVLKDSVAKMVQKAG